MKIAKWLYLLFLVTYVVCSLFVLPYVLYRDWGTHAMWLEFLLLIWTIWGSIRSYKKLKEYWSADKELQMQKNRDSWKDSNEVQP